MCSRQERECMKDRLVRNLVGLHAEPSNSGTSCPMRPPHAKAHFSANHYSELKSSIPPMIKNLPLLFLFSSALCAGQSVLTTPTVETQSAPANAPAAGTGQAPLQRPTQVVGDQVPGTTAPGTRDAPTAVEHTAAPGTTRIAGPLTSLSEFEQYAEDATGRRLPVYGRQ